MMVWDIRVRFEEDSYGNESNPTQALRKRRRVCLEAVTSLCMLTTGILIEM